MIKRLEETQTADPGLRSKHNYDRWLDWQI